MKKLFLMIILIGMKSYCSARARSLDENGSSTISTATIPTRLVFEPAPKAPESYWDNLKNLASYLNFYQMYKNYKNQEAQRMFDKYGINQEQLNQILFNHPDFFTYSGYAQDSIVAFAKKEQELVSKSLELDEVLRYTVDPIFQGISNDIRLLHDKTSSVSSGIELQALRTQIKSLEDQQIKVLTLMQEAQERIIRIKLDTLDKLSRDKLSRPLKTSIGTQTMVTGNLPPARYISPYRPQQQMQFMQTARPPVPASSMSKTTAQPARSSDDDYWNSLETMRTGYEPRRAVQFRD